MAIQSEIRKSDIYTGDGATTQFSFAFKLLAAADAEVRVTPDGGTESVLPTSSFVCSLNSDQDNNPGGKITLSTPLADGASLVIVSAEAYSQPAVFTNRGAFYPTVLNDSLDRLTIQTQQLKEGLSRAVTVDATDTMTPAEFKEKLLTTADAAREAAEAAEAAEAEAKTYASQAQTSASAAKTSELQTAAYAEAATVVAPIADQVKTVANIADDVSTVSGIAPDVRTVAGVSTSVTKVASIATETQVVGSNIATISRATGLLNHTSDLQALSQHVNDLHRVGQDLLVSDEYEVSYDLGLVTDGVEPTGKVTGGVLKSVADHLDDCIHPVGQKIDDVHDVAANLATISRATGLVNHVADIAALSPHIDDLHRVGQDLLVSDNTDVSYDYGSVSDVVEPETVVTGGILKNVSDHIEDCIHPVAQKLDDIHTVGMVAAEVAAVAGLAEEVKLAAVVGSHIDDLQATSEHLDEVHIVGQDLQGVNDPSLDLGLVTEDAHPVVAITGGYIKSVGEVADEVQTVAGVKDSVVAVAAMADQLAPLLSLAEVVTEVTQTDYKTIFLNGLSE